ncbi:zinc finger protein 597 [Rhinolophus ferrumequinum]|uniref:Zinc finger protein 597 n=1 Tax=Rhinolophus ferrumequinum TaxID=59479 RepID=A0A7J7R6Z1_RHIFE|nr:zinc finger protein 597 [Rhinolophus ferrumequinum]
MVSMLAPPRAQGLMLFEDLTVYFSQEESVSLYPGQRSLSRNTTQECFEDMALMEKSSETGVRVLERKISGGTSACKKMFISLVVTIENHTPLIELSQYLVTRALSEILQFPGKEARNSYKCPECD